MKKNRLWIVLLLLSFSFSMVHAFVIEANEVDHCTVQEYIQELSGPVECGDLCDIHHMFHLSFIMIDNVISFDHDAYTNTPIQIEKKYSFHLNSSSFRPPITA